MPRSNSLDVQNILGNDYTPGLELTGYIQTADMLVDQVIAYGARKGITVTDGFEGSQADIIERWLAAHYTMVMTQQYAWRKSEGASAAFQGKSNMYLESTIYGQQAVAMDPTGYLSTIASEPRKRASLTWDGLPPSQQIPYIERN
jgi:hypothetical protein